MLQGERATKCPLCHAQLGATVEGQWVPMALDEYREHAALRLIPNPAAMAAPGSCVACGSGPQRAEAPQQFSGAVRIGTHVNPLGAARISE